VVLAGLPGPDARGTVVLVSGERGVGKSTLLLAVREAAVRAGLRTGGFLSVARFADGEKTGIDLMDAASGAVHPLAQTGGSGPVQTGRYTFDAGALAAGVGYAETSRTADLFFVDELGPLELVRGEGWAAVLPMIAAHQFGVALVVVRPALLDLAREVLVLPPGAPLITVTRQNRDALRTALPGWVAGQGR
jgi:nucleoside-triphosphatase